jgi:exodeoxyribonuclease VII large subunit
MEPKPTYSSTLTSDPLARDVYTPARLNQEARMLLERGFSSLWLEGEISNLSRPSSGHWYFSLKDASAQLRCAMFRQKNLMTRFSPKDGMHVLARGRVSLYEPRGDYQFIVDHLEDAGEGALKRQFELLKARLAAAGLFAAEHKKPLPRLPKRIGVITSPTGAAIRDILNILRRRFPAIPVLIYPVPVQGAAAAEEIAAAIRLAVARAECDVLILARGGGSLEDLWAFNEEVVARAIFECPLPLVTGIGHEVDFTIADFVADVRAPTPSGAAELVVPDRDEWLRNFVVFERRLVTQLARTLESRRESFVWMQRRLERVHPGIQLRQHAQRLDEMEQRLVRALKQLVSDHRARWQDQAGRLRQASPALRLSALRGRLAGLEIQLQGQVRSQLQRLGSFVEAARRTLYAVSPEATLERGYAIVMNASGGVVMNASALRPGERIAARLAKGNVTAVVEEIMHAKTQDQAGPTGLKGAE